MMGEPVGRQDRLFYQFDLEAMVPGDGRLRRIAGALDLSWLARRDEGPLQPDHLAGDVAYGTGEMLGWLVARNIDPHIPV